jgi:putative transposase
MPRKPRPEIPGAFFHIFTRGNAKARLYLDDFDYQAWLGTLAGTVEQFGWRCHAYCAMPNHFHLLIETPQPTRSAGMRHLNGSYAQRFNTRYEASGHVFQGRYGANVVTREAQLLETARYIVLNPVRAGLRDTPDQWHWSSYRATAGLAPAAPFLTREFALAMFGGGVAEAQARYRQFVADGQVPGPGPGTVARIRHASPA